MASWEQIHRTEAPLPGNWVSSSVQAVLLQRHRTLLRSRGINRTASRAVSVLLIITSWFVLVVAGLLYAGSLPASTAPHQLDRGSPAISSQIGTDPKVLSERMVLLLAVTIFHLTALLLITVWWVSDRVSVRDQDEIERALSGATLGAFKDATAEKWEDVYAYFRVQRSQYPLPSYYTLLLRWEPLLWIYLLVMSWGSCAVEIRKLVL
jgi:hypothetical protein